MSAPENPERLWAYAHREGDIRAETDADLAEQDRGEYGCNPAPVAEYVRKDIVEAALKHLAERLERAEAEVRSLRAVVRQAHLDLETGSEASCTVSLHLYRALDDATKEAKP